MGKFSACFGKLKLVVVAFVFGLLALPSFGQVFNDGPIQLMAKVRSFNITFAETDVAFFGVVGQPDDLSYNMWGREPVGNGVSWLGGGPGLTCSANAFREDFTPPLTDWNQVFYNFTYPTPANGGMFEVQLDCWEDESPDQLLGVGCGGSRCAYDVGFCCGGFVFGVCVGSIDDDDLHCNSGSTTPYASLNYRLGPPCQWYNHGFVPGACPANFYNPMIETFWRYTDGDACANAIALGNVNPGFTTISHFNSNECYTDAIAYPGGGQDVVYEINVTQPVGLVVNTCGVGSMASDVLVLNSSCTIQNTNSGFCGNGSEIGIPICNPGIYYIVVEGRAGATGTFTLEVSEDPGLIVTADAGPNASVCVGLGVQIGAQLPSLPAVGGQGPYTYSWTPTTFITSTTDSITTVFPPTTTTYTLTVTDGLGCVSQDSTIVTVNPGPAVNIGPDQTVCPGAPIPLDAGPGFSSYFWSTGDFTQTVNVSTPGQYQAVVTDLNGCIGRDTMELFNYPAPAITIGNDTSICLGVSLFLDAGPGFTNYNWNTGATNQNISTTASGVFAVTVTDANSCVANDTVVVVVDTLPVPVLPAIVTKCPDDITVLNPGAGWPNYIWNNGVINQVLPVTTAGPYAVTVTDGNGCEGTASTNVADYTQPLGFGLTAPANFFCQGSNITLDAGAGATITNYFWSDGTTTQTNTVSSSGYYHVTATDVNGCEWKDSIQVTESPNPTVELGPDQTICSGSNALLTATPGFTYAWSTGAASQIISATATGMYYVTVSNPGTNCFAVDSVMVTVTPSPTPVLAPAVVLCDGESTTLDPGPGFASYTWSTGANSQSISVANPGTYTVTVTNSDGCVSTASTNVSNFPAVVATISGNLTGCEGTPETLVATGGFASYLWSNGATTQAIPVNGTGTYSVTATTADGCEATGSISVTFNPEPVLNLDPLDTICPGAQVTLDAGSGFSSYLWSTGEQTPTIQAGGQGIYGVTVTNASGCSASGQIELVKSQTPLVDIGPANVNICDAGEITILAGPWYASYDWSTGSFNQFITVDQPGVYSVTVTDALGCVSTDNVTVSENGITHQDFLATSGEICAGEEYLVDAGDQWLHYQWANGSRDQYFLTSTAGTFYVTVTDPGGCRYSDSIEVTVLTPPTLELGANMNICPSEVLTLDAGSGFDTYLWSTGESSQSIDINSSGNYYVTVTYNMCTLDDVMNIGDDCPGRLFIPNVFSPNGDGLNDFFHVDYVNMETLNVQIYDRWGKYLYESNNKDFQWNGTFNGNPLPEGSYYYTVNFKYSDNENPEERRGTVLIIR